MPRAVEMTLRVSLTPFEGTPHPIFKKGEQDIPAGQNYRLSPFSVLTTCRPPPVCADSEFVGGGYGDSHQHHHHQAPNGATGTSPNDVRHRQIFHTYPSSYSTDGGVSVTTIPPATYDAMDPMGGHPTNPAAITTSTAKGDGRNVELFGDLPEAKRRKFILVDDTQRGARVRVRVMLDQVEMKEIPDSYRKTNSVFPRSYFPMQMQSPTAATGDSRFPDEDSPEEDGDSSGRPGRGRTLVPVPMLDGSEREVPMPRISRAKRRKEATLNDLGYRMSWSQSRVFAGRTLFLQRARMPLPINFSSTDCSN